MLAGKLYGIPVAGTMAHSFVMSFKRELDSFLAYAQTFPANTILLVDTYDTKKGIENAVKVGLYLKKNGHRLLGIRLDSGDIASLSRFARKRFDSAGLKSVKIFASGNLDEFKIKELLIKGARVDSFGVGTNMGASIDAPCLDVIYKLSEVTDTAGKFMPVMKLSKAKITYPGRKQVFRVFNKSGRFIKDILGLEKENIKGEPLLIKVVDKGNIRYRTPSLDEIRRLTQRNLSRLPHGMKEVHVIYKNPLEISRGLKKLRNALVRKMEKRQ